MLFKYGNEIAKENSSIEKLEDLDCAATFIIKSLSDYINLITSLNKQKNGDCPSNKAVALCYRGIKDSTYKLEPSIKFSNLFDFESELVDEFIRLRPEEFNGINNDFELLSKMQHFGLPTRLLDFSYNPLVALYFACLENKVDEKVYEGSEIEKHKDGRVYVLFNEVEVIKAQKAANIICSMHRHEYGSLFHKDILKHKDLFDANKISTEDYITIVFKMIDGSIMLRPPYISERERRQESVFMVFANNMTGLDNWYIKTGDKLETSLYVKNRPQILFTDSLKLISDEELMSNYISFIIRSDDKSKILRELNYFGINEAFLFPELEYTANEIKNKYLKIIKKSEID